LFGHEKGAFTGAMRQKRGLFELCDAGTLLLDEISEMTTALQAKLLRVVQEREIQRLGSDRAVAVDVRVVATTNRHLPTEVANGHFREDLYFRLNVVEVNLPPLRERADDIPLLVEHFLQRFNHENGRSIKRINDAAMRLLVSYHWPGNVRELENYLERAIVTASGEVLTPDDFPTDLATGGPKPRNAPIGVGSTIHDMEKWLILTTLEAEANNQTRAADKLGISSRTLRNKLYEYGVKTPGGNGGNDRADGKSV
jgi:transcriptional regulator with PAS, ATPase and Fis domain